MFFEKIPRRVLVGLMLFGGVVVNYTMRVNLSVNIVTMVPVTESRVFNDTSAGAERPATLGWSPYQRGLVLGAYYWGYLISTSLCSGPVIKRFGPRLVVLITTLISAILVFASPSTAKVSALAMIILRVAHGFCGGFMLPSVQALIAHWGVTAEKGKFVACLETGTGGTVVAWSLCGVIIEAWGWEWAFYIFGITAILVCVPWWLLVYDSPEEHRQISIAEKQFIADGTSGVSADLKIPYAKILISVPVWADIIGSFGSGWGSYIIVNSAPMFIANVLNYNVASTGFLSSIIYLVKAIAAILWGVITDVILGKKWVSLRVLRKSFTVFSHIIPGILLVLLAFNNDALMAIILLSLLMALNAGITVTTTINCQDLAPSFAGAVYGLSNGGYTVAGIFTPMVVAHFTQSDETNFKAWQPIFFTGAGICILSGLIFIIFGSTEIQHWNKIDDAEGTKMSKLSE